MQDIITMSIKELHRVEILQKLIDKRLIEHEAAKQLGLSIRQIRRLSTRVESGLKFSIVFCKNYKEL
jgi:Trp operon repressor